MNYYGKYYESMGAGQCRSWYHFSIGWWRKSTFETRLFGYYEIYYDGAFHFFNVWPFVIRWHKRPITKQSYEESKGW